MADEVGEKGGDVEGGVEGGGGLVARPGAEVGLQRPQVEVVRERVDVGEVLELVTLVREDDGQLRRITTAHALSGVSQNGLRIGDLTNAEVFKRWKVNWSSILFEVKKMW